MEYIISALFGYLLGSIPFGLVLCKIFGLGDIRSIGSGNIGATNVLRTGNKPLALATLLLDSGKGAIAVLAIPFLIGAVLFFLEGLHADTNYNLLGMLAGFFALIGHCYPVWLKFKGGKGVATTLGTLIAIYWPLGLAACAIWLISALIFRISSLSALIAVGLTPIIAHFMTGNANLSGLCALIAALVYVKHRENIKRIFAGTEPKIGKKKSEVEK
jgi:glycerol-3-phosphate acyltransferase PlsY